MKRFYLLIAIILLSLVLPALAGKRVPGNKTYTTAPPQTRFTPLAIYVDSGKTPLGAYQIELKAQPGSIKIVGVEGGEHKAFSSPPHYDPAALMNERIIIAAFSTDQDLPLNRTRVATIHLQVIGDQDPAYELIPMTAAHQNGQEAEIIATYEQGREN